ATIRGAGDPPGSATLLVPAAPAVFVSPRLPAGGRTHWRARRPPGPQATRCAPSGVLVRAASVRRSSTTRRASARCQSGIESADYTAEDFCAAEPLRSRSAATLDP